MTREKIVQAATLFVENAPDNYVSEGVAIRPAYAGLKIFDAPVFSFGAADDPLYERYKSPDVIGEHFIKPSEWLPEAQTIIAFFLPFTEPIKKANRQNEGWPADEWLHGRIEGQILIQRLSAYIKDFLENEGFKSLVPAASSQGFTTNWSERHAAFACGLGTFGLSKGIITIKGMCGRLGSLLTELKLPVDQRPYTEVYEYCDRCGVCIKRCPVNAISFEKGKVHKPCSDFLDVVREKHHPRYGCGKCQVNVPCESGIPHSSN